MKLRTEDRFIELLQCEMEVKGNVKPFSRSLLERMFAIKKLGDSAKADMKDRTTTYPKTSGR